MPCPLLIFSQSENSTLRKHAYSKILKIPSPKTESFQIKVLIFFFSYFCSKHRLRYSCEPPGRGGSNEYPYSMFLSRNKKNNIYPCKPQFYCIKVGFKGVKNILACFRDVSDCCYKSIYLMANSADPDQLASSEAN